MRTLEDLTITAGYPSSPTWVTGSYLNYLIRIIRNKIRLDRSYLNYLIRIFRNKIRLDRSYLNYLIRIFRNKIRLDRSLILD